jgi:8-amino-7-oxononanoate synthase
MNLKDFANEKIAGLKAKNRFRILNRYAFDSPPYIYKNAKRLVSFASNDYLGLSQHPQVRNAASAAALEYGSGAGSSRLVSGNHSLYEDLEQKLAASKHCQSACVFGSGYLANIGVMQSLADATDLILADKLSHACIIDGAKLSGASLKRFHHNDVDNLRELLLCHRKDYKNCLIATESIFSMDGDKAPLPEILKLTEEFDCWLLVDDAHSLYSPRIPLIAGVDISSCERLIIIGTLSKALGGYGGYAASNTKAIEYIKSAARSVIFSTALPPSVLASALKSLEIIDQNPSLCDAPLVMAQLFKAGISERFGRLKALSAACSSHIIPIIIGDDLDAVKASQMMEDNGFLVPAIRPPTVPPGTARLRLSFSSHHRAEDVEGLVEVLQRWIV